MADKTRLELDLEHHERYGTSIGIKILIILLVIGLGGAGFYAFTLHEKLVEKETEIAQMIEDFRNEKVALLSRIKRLEVKASGQEPLNAK